MPAKWSTPWNMPFPAARSKPWWVPYSIGSPPALSIRSRSARKQSMATDTIAIQEVYAEADSVWQADLLLAAQSTVEQALQASRFARLFPNYPYDQLKVGVYGQECTLDRVLTDGDRTSTSLNSSQ